MAPTKEINLISHKSTVSPEQARLSKLFGKLIPAVLAGYSLILGIALLVSLYMNTTLASTERSIATETSTIELLAQNEGLFLLLKQKSSVLSAIFASRFPYPELYEFFEGYKSERARFSSIEFSADDMLSLTVEVSDSEEIDRFVTQLLQDAKERFSRIELTGVQRTTANTYLVVLAFDAL